MKRFDILFFAFAMLMTMQMSHAQIPRSISYQGVLTDNAGQPQPDGNYVFTFKLYDGATEIWTERKTLEVKKGILSTALGDSTAFGPTVLFDKPYSLGIKVGAESELSPRIPLTSVGYSMNAHRADTARVALVSSGGGMWNGNDSIAYRLAGRVGIGTLNPLDELDITTTGFNNPGLAFNNDLGSAGDISYYRDRSLSSLIRMSSDNHGSTWDFQQRAPDLQSRLFVSGDGNVGIGSNTPTAKLEIDQSSSIQYAASFRNGDGNGPGLSIKAGTANSVSPILWVGDNSGTVSRFEVQGNGNVGIGTDIPSARLEVIGHTKTSVLEITGGSDLAEPFEMSHAETLEPGSVVVIDEDNSGKLKLSSKPYDRRVAGVVSGAGGVNPGLTLKQEGIMEKGQNVALSGRVYVKATASNGAIRPGDLLTTSEMPGCAMRASDEAMKPGVTIGKAMSRLENGEGLVLVLVNLQ